MKNTEVITLGAGCFWCIEAILNELKGVLSVQSGYTGGIKPNPTYQEICNGQTGHAEVAQIIFDRKLIGLEEILEVFFTIHDPTTLNRQGNDIGTQYRSAIFYSNIDHKIISEQIIKRLNADEAFPNKIVTEVTELGTFYAAEDYHQNYLDNNSENPYCQMIVRPKLEKFKLAFPHRIKS
jgi:peptide-methionine (S)-S-oxide reductase